MDTSSAGTAMLMSLDHMLVLDVCSLSASVNTRKCNKNKDPNTLRPNHIYTHLSQLHTPKDVSAWAFFESILYHVYIPNYDILPVSFRLCGWLSERCLGSWINHVPLVHYRQRYGILEKHNGNTRIWDFDLLEMAGHQPKVSIAALMQLSRVVLYVTNAICNVLNLRFTI